jgi:hypothetical protein
MMGGDLMIVYTDKRGFKYQVGQMLCGGYRGMYQKPNEKKWHSMRLDICETYDSAQKDLDRYAGIHKFDILSVNDINNVVCNLPSMTRKKIKKL